MKAKLPPTTREWLKIHADNGCTPACKFCEAEWIGRGPCCTFSGTLTFGPTKPYCATRNSRRIE